MITTIVFDIGQVLVHFRWKEYIDEFGFSPEVTKKLIYATVENIDHWSLHDKGELSDEEFIQRCKERAPGIEAEIQTFFDHIERIVEEFEYAPRLVKQLKDNGYKVYVLSNYGASTFEIAKKGFKFLEFMDGGIISSHEKMIKPDPEIYQLLIDRYQIDPTQAVFLDDRLDNIQAAQEFGFHTVHFQGIEQGIKELDNLKVNLEGFQL